MGTNKQRVIVIAEAGVNHNGNYDMAVEMIHVAKNAGADYVKFQTAVPELVISTFAPKAEYQKATTGEAESQLEMCKAIHLPLSAYKSLKEECRKCGIGFMSTPFDLVSIDLLNDLGQDYFKIPSGEITNLPYLRRIAKTGIPVIMSTGMSDYGDIEKALNVLYAEGMKREQITLLHCNTQYPTPYCDVNLRAMNGLKTRFGVKVGYSDHTPGYEVTIAAVALGAEVVEKHFTLDKNLPGPDHKASLSPQELAEMVQCVRNVEISMGSDIKFASPSETPNKDIARKSIVASRAIKAGEILSEQNIAVKRPGNGISPMLWDKVVGTAAVRDFDYDELIEI
ncbi:MAG: N-acetylneuraminate synthase [Muribaculaceae bacterium]|nr:N-acetylneuraminate synthase [Muribaculaceae bacterium]